MTSVWQGSCCGNSSISEVIVTGGNYAVPPNIGLLILNALANPIAAFTVVTPLNPQDQQEFMLYSKVAITALTLSVNMGENAAGFPTGMVANTSISVKFNAADGTWYRMW